MSKQCTVCHRYLKESDFYDKKRSKVRKDGTVHRWTGKYSQCKNCIDGRNKKERHKYDEYYKKYRLENKERIKERTRHFYIKAKLEWIDLISTIVDLKCSKCGYNKTWAALDFHHVDRSTKENTIHKIMSKSRPNAETWDLMKTEISKCIVLCSNCHREEHMVYNLFDDDLRNEIAPKITDAMRKD